MALSNSNYWTTNPKGIQLINYLIEKTKDAKSPINLHQLSREYKEKCGAERLKPKTTSSSILLARSKIHDFVHIAVDTKIKMLFALSAPINAGLLKELKEDALVDVDEKNRITYYKANDGNLELKGDHSPSAKTKNALLESKRSLRKRIHNSFINNSNADEDSKNEEQREIRNLIKFITEKCANVSSPLSLKQLAKGFISHFGASQPISTIRSRIKSYGREIQKLDNLNVLTKVKQLFGLSVPVDTDYLEELRKSAVVEVDHKNRIVKYTANDGSFTIQGSHWGSGKTKPGYVTKRKENNVEAMTDGYDEESDDDGLNADSDEYSSEEFDSEFDSDNENNLEEPEDHVDSSTGLDPLDCESPVRRRSPSIKDSFDYGHPTERHHRSKEAEMKENVDKENDPGNAENAPVKTKYGRVSKRRHLDSEFSYDFVNSFSSRASARSNSGSSKFAIKKKKGNQKEQPSTSSCQSSNSPSPMRRFTRNTPFSLQSTSSNQKLERQNDPMTEEDPVDYDGPRIQEMNDSDYDPRENSVPEDFFIDNHIEEPEPGVAEGLNLNLGAQNAENRQNAAVPEPQSVAEPNLETQNVENRPEEVVPKPQPAEDNEPQNNENFTVKQKSSPPPTDGNEFIPIKTHIRILESLLSIMTTFDTPTLTEDQERIEKTVEMFKSNGNKEERIRMNELRTSLMTCLLIVSKSAKKEIVKGENTTSLEGFLLLLISSLVPLKLKELDGFVLRLRHMVKEDNEKRFPTKKVQSALQPILDIAAP